MTIQKAAERLFPRGMSRALSDHWDEAIVYADLTTPERKAMFLAQTGHESGGFRRLEENLSYSSARLLAVWPSRFGNGKANPNDYARNPEKLSNFVYGGRMGNTHPGDGWKYRGRGLIMLTGKDNYSRVKVEGVDFLANPDLAAHPRYALLVAAWFWKHRRLNRYEGNVSTTTRALNGGLIGLEDRVKLYRQAISILNQSQQKKS